MEQNLNWFTMQPRCVSPMLYLNHQFFWQHYLRNLSFGGRISTLHWKKSFRWKSIWYYWWHLNLLKIGCIIFKNHYNFCCVCSYKWINLTLLIRMDSCFKQRHRNTFCLPLCLSYRLWSSMIYLYHFVQQIKHRKKCHALDFSTKIKW